MPNKGAEKFKKPMVDFVDRTRTVDEQLRDFGCTLGNLSATGETLRNSIMALYEEGFLDRVALCHATARLSKWVTNYTVVFDRPLYKAMVESKKGVYSNTVRYVERPTDLPHPPFYRFIDQKAIVMLRPKPAPVSLRKGKFSDAEHARYKILLREINKEER